MSRNISSMIAEVRSQTDEVRGAVERLRMANRRMTGSTGEQPTPLVNAKAGVDRGESAPLLDEMNAALEQLNAVTADMRSEIAHMEGYTETGAPSEKGYATVASGRG